jgi:hypothetical protein
MVLLYGRAGHSTTKNDGFGPGQYHEKLLTARQQVRLSTVTAVPSLALLLLGPAPSIQKDTSGGAGAGGPTLLLASPDAPSLRWRCTPRHAAVLERLASVVRLGQYPIITPVTAALKLEPRYR